MRLRPLFPPQDSTGKPHRHKGSQPYTLLTINGRVQLRRIRWQSPELGSYTLIDAWLVADLATISQGVREMVCRLNRVSHSFQGVAENLKRLAHIQAGKEAIRLLVEQEGRQVLQLQQQQKLTPNWTAQDCTIEDPTTDTKDRTTRLYLGCDGVMVPLITEEEKSKRRQKIRQKRMKRGRKAKPLPRRNKGSDQSYKEFRVVVIHDETQKHRTVAMCSGDHREVGRLMRRLGRQVQLEEAKQSIANIDGAPWIRTQIESHDLVDHLGLDYYHLREKVQQARRVLYNDQPKPDDENRSKGKATSCENDPPDTTPGGTWKRSVMGKFLEEGCKSAVSFLKETQRQLRGGKRKALDVLLNYVEPRSEMIKYPEFRKQGWQIGSGPTEAQCKTATSRLKGRGRRWDRRNAESIMALDCLHSSRDWNQYWQLLSTTKN